MTLAQAAADAGGGLQTGPFGSQLHAADYVTDGVPSVMPQNIGDNVIVDREIARIDDADAARLSRYLLRSGDIVYSRRGDVGKRALVRASQEGWLCGTGCLRIRFGDDSIDPAFASYQLGHPAVRRWIQQHAIGATMPNLNTAILGGTPFVVPPIEEQRRVVGESMNRRIPNGAYCLFRHPVEGSRDGRVVLVEQESITDPDHGGQYTVKVYRSEREPSSDGSWRHTEIRLEPDTAATGYEPIVLRDMPVEAVRVIAELVEVLPGSS